MLTALRGADAALADVDAHRVHLEAEVVGALLGREDVGQVFALVPDDVATAQVCSECGHKEASLAVDLTPLWICPECGAVHSRKGNGAVNVLAAGKDILTGEALSHATREAEVVRVKRDSREAAKKGTRG